MFKVLWTICIAGALLLACEKTPPKKISPDDYVIATIGKEKVYFSEVKRSAEGLNRFLKENFDTSKEWRLDYIRKHVARYALTKRAIHEGLEKNGDVIFAMEQAGRNILSDKIINDQLDKVKITEDDIRNYYEQNKTKYQQTDKKGRAKDKPFDEVKSQVEFDYSKKIRDEIIDKFIRETLTMEKVQIYDEVIEEKMK